MSDERPMWLRPAAAPATSQAFRGGSLMSRFVDPAATRAAADINSIRSIVAGSAHIGRPTPAAAHVFTPAPKQLSSLASLARPYSKPAVDPDASSVVGRYLPQPFASTPVANRSYAEVARGTPSGLAGSFSSISHGAVPRPVAQRQSVLLTVAQKRDTAKSSFLSATRQVAYSDSVTRDTPKFDAKRPRISEEPRPFHQTLSRAADPALPVSHAATWKLPADTIVAVDRAYRAAEATTTGLGAPHFETLHPQMTSISQRQEDLRETAVEAAAAWDDMEELTAILRTASLAESVRKPASTAPLPLQRNNATESSLNNAAGSLLSLSRPTLSSKPSLTTLKAIDKQPVPITKPAEKQKVSSVQPVTVAVSVADDEDSSVIEIIDSDDEPPKPSQTTTVAAPAAKPPAPAASTKPRFELDVAALAAQHRAAELMEEILRETSRPERIDLAGLSKRLLDLLTKTTTAADVQAINDTKKKGSQIIAVKGGVEVIGEDLKTLAPGQWLNDNIICYFLKIIEEHLVQRLAAKQALIEKQKSEGQLPAGAYARRVHLFNTYFWSKLIENGYTYANVERWTNRPVKITVMECEAMIVPINHSNTHWACAVIWPQRKEVSYFDSLGNGKFEKVTKTLLRWVHDEHLKKTGEDMDMSTWKAKMPPHDLPQQENGYDCGVFTCMFCLHLALGLQDNMMFCQSHINNIRQFIAKSIVKQGFSLPEE